MARDGRLKLPLALASALLLGACSDAPISIGERTPTLARSDLAAYAANWDGYAEAYHFEDDTDRVRLMLDDKGQGALRFGERDLLAPTSPTAYYPPSYESLDAWKRPATDYTWSGLNYVVRNTRVLGGRIRLESDSSSPFTTYCALQTPYHSELNGGGYACLPYTMLKSLGAGNSEQCTIPATTSGSSYAPGDPAIEVNCEQLAMCSGDERGCTCTETECNVGVSDSNISLDAALDEGQDTLVGTLVLGSDRITLRLERE
jgi:hypothetical protein